jgi:hypothetical protein
MHLLRLGIGARREPERARGGLDERAEGRVLRPERDDVVHGPQRDDHVVVEVRDDRPGGHRRVPREVVRAEEASLLTGAREKQDRPRRPLRGTL